MPKEPWDEVLARGSVDVSQGTEPVAEGFRSAFAEAARAGTPDAWNEAARVVALVADMARTIQLAVSARDDATRLAQVAEEAERQARIAVDSARNAVNVAQDAAREAASALLSAEEVSGAAPGSERAAQAAVRAQADVTSSAAELEHLGVPRLTRWSAVPAPSRPG
jgi:hypothetical protein